MYRMDMPEAIPARTSAVAIREGTRRRGRPPPPPPQQQQRNVSPVEKNTIQPQQSTEKPDGPEKTKKMSSGYATTSHSAEIIDEDIYVSDGSESDEDLMADKLQMISQQNPSSDGTVDDSENTNNGTNIAGRSIEMVLSGSKMGLMRRGIHRPQQLVQPNRQWARQSQTQQDPENDKSANDGEDGSGDGGDDANDEERRKREQEEELAKLDPAQRAARLLAEKQRKLEEAKILARKLESEENAGRDPCLFSKRTSFDIRFDQIDDKPWLRGAGDITDFFNYGFSEEDWLEYGEQQLMIRQELIDANRQKRPPDPSIVPVVPKKPKKQNPRVAVATNDAAATEEGASSTAGVKNEDGEDSSTTIGPLRKKNTKDDLFPTANDVTSCEIIPKQGPASNQALSAKNDLPDNEVGVGGAWGVGAAPGTVLAKLIEEQDKQQKQKQNQKQQNNFQKKDDSNMGRQEKSHDPHQSKDSPRKGRGMDHYGRGSSKYENDPALSYYGSGVGDSGAGYNDNKSDKPKDHPYGRSKRNSQQDEDTRHGSGEGNRNHRYQNHGGQGNRNNPGANQNNGDWNSRNSERGPANRHQDYNQGWDDGGRGGYRGGNQGGGGRRGGGDHGDGKGRNRGGSNYGDRGGRRKRSRDEYDDRYGRR
mmetsp:Transcript_18683/g.43236  ORF Transcript_18683/g.43236 Transcript_18683/m.43236 type:complete len:647 (-) Transcript_18683:385-2325(-)